MSKFKNNKNRNLKEQCLIYLGGKKCKKCGVSHLPQQCYDFHHTKGNKEDNISKMIQKGVSFEKLKKELDKCIIWCKNCHTEYHALK